MEEFYKDIEFILRASAPLAVGAIGYAAYRFGYYWGLKHTKSDEITKNLNRATETAKRTAETVKGIRQDIQRMKADLGDGGQDWDGEPLDLSGLDGWLGPEDFYNPNTSTRKNPL